MSCRGGCRAIKGILATVVTESRVSQNHMIVTVAFTCQFGHSAPIGHYPPSALMMDGQLDVASTSDADERELLEAANFDLYWDHVIARSQVDSHRHPPPPNALPDQDDDM